jgi:hypothetical protein
MSANSDEVSEKVVSKLITSALIGIGCYYLVGHFPGLVWVIILGGILSIVGVVLYGIAGAAWDQLTGPQRTASKVGKILMAVGVIGWAGGFSLLKVTEGDHRSGPPDEMSSYLFVGGFLAFLVGGVITLIVWGQSSTNGSRP